MGVQPLMQYNRRCSATADARTTVEERPFQGRVGNVRRIGLQPPGPQRDESAIPSSSFHSPSHQR
jgi:hypothetical protein